LLVLLCVLLLLLLLLIQLLLLLVSPLASVPGHVPGHEPLSCRAQVRLGHKLRGTRVPTGRLLHGRRGVLIHFVTTPAAASVTGVAHGLLLLLLLVLIQLLLAEVVLATGPPVGVGGGAWGHTPGMRLIVGIAVGIALTVGIHFVHSLRQIIHVRVRGTP